MSCTVLSFGTINIGNVDKLRVVIKKNDVAWDLTSAAVTFRFKNPVTGEKFNRTATIEDPTNGIAYYDTLTTDILVAGTWKVNVMVVDGSITKNYPNAITLIVEDRP